MQLQELVGDLEKEELLMVKDYIAAGKKRTPEKVSRYNKRTNKRGFNEITKYSQAIRLWRF